MAKAKIALLYRRLSWDDECRARVSQFKIKTGFVKDKFCKTFLFAIGHYHFTRKSIFAKGCRRW